MNDICKLWKLHVNVYHIPIRKCWVDANCVNYSYNLSVYCNTYCSHYYIIRNTSTGNLLQKLPGFVHDKILRNFLVQCRCKAQLVNQCIWPNALGVRSISTTWCYAQRVLCHRKMSANLANCTDLLICARHWVNWAMQVNNCAANEWQLKKK